jgi:phosphoribosylformimino-5-aminoimidazole carboxamide ribotide isomerase
MIVIPAVDLLGGKAVRLLQGRYDQVTVFDEDPVARARAWGGQVDLLHVVDLEGARDGQPAQGEVVRAIVAAFGGDVQVGGGIRTRASFASCLALGATRVVLGSAAVSDPELVRALASENPGRVVVAVDARDGLVTVDGWTRATPVRATDLVRSLADVALAGVLYTDVARDGMRTGPNVEVTAQLVACTTVPVIASGGVGSLDDLRALASRGIAACIVGRALYEGAFTLEQAVAAAARA